MTLMEQLGGFRHRNVHVLLNPGNAGDGLIHLGGRRLFRELGLRTREFLYPADVRGEVLLVHGCGGFGGVSAHRVEQSGHYLGRFDEVVILPSSFDAGREDVRRFLSGLPRHVSVWCREKISHAAVLEVVPDPGKVGLDRDLAFHCDYRRWAAHPGSGTLLSFRTDAESAQDSPPAGSIDVSRFGDKFDAWPLLYTVSRFREVHTDRLHVGIAAAMTGRQTRLYDNSYHKIRGVYEYSLSGMDHVRYMGNRRPGVSPPPASRVRMRLIHFGMRIRKPLVRAACHLPRRRFRSADPPVTG